MIVMIERGGERMVFADVTRIEEKQIPSVVSDTRTVVVLWSGNKLVMGNEKIDLGDTRIIPLPNAEVS